MGKKELVSYIRKSLSSRYSLSSIRSELKNSGYSQKEIESAIGSVYHPVQGSGMGRPVIIGLVAAVILVFSIMALFLVISPSKDVKYQINPLTVEVFQGGNIVFEDILESVGRKDGFRVSLKYDVINPSTGSLVVTDSQTAIAGDRDTSKITLPIPIVQPGRYLLKGSASFDGDSVEDSFTFRVLKLIEKTSEPIEEVPGGVIASETILAPICPGDCNDFDPCTSDSCVEGVCFNSEIILCCGNFVCEDGETAVTCSQDCGIAPEVRTTTDILQEAEQFASIDKDRAGRLCSSLPRIVDSDNCYTSIAGESKDKTFCDRVDDSTKKDNCFMSFALTLNDFTVCDKISNTYLQKSCFSLKNLRALQFAAEEASQKQN